MGPAWTMSGPIKALFYQNTIDYRFTVTTSTKIHIEHVQEHDLLITTKKTTERQTTLKMAGLGTGLQGDYEGYI